jgi:hypothetical protein
MTETPIPRGWSRATRLLVAGLVGVVVTAIVAGVVVVRTRDDVPSVLPDAATAFGDDRVLDESLVWASFSPSGRLLLVRTREVIGIAVEGEIAPLTPEGSSAVDAAWFPSENAVLVAEGPISTGQLTVVELDGTVRGSVPVDPSFAVGSGYGMTIAPDGRRAVVTAEERETIGGARHLHLVLVDLETGAVTELTPPDGPDERTPAFVTDDLVIYTETAAGADPASRVMAVELSSGETSAVSPAGRSARVLGTLDGRAAYAAGRAVWVGTEDDRRRFGTADGHVLAVHPDGRLIVVSRAGQAELEAITTGIR